MRKNILRTTGLVLLTFAALSAFAQEETEQSVSSTLPKPAKVETSEGWRPHVGATLGVTNPEGSYESSPEFGLNIGYQPYIPYGMGAEISRSSARAKGGASDLDRTTLLARGTYNFGGTNKFVRNSYAGVGLGAILKRDGTDAVSAPIVGFDIPLKENNAATYMSVGADAKYLIVGSSDSDTLVVNGVMKYWY